MRKGRVLKKIFELAVKQSPVTNVSSEERNFKCSRFLCASDGSCKDVDCKTPLYTPSHYYNLLSALAHILLSVGGSSDLSRIFLPAVERCSGWAECFDRRQVRHNILLNIFFCSSVKILYLYIFETQNKSNKI